MGVAQSMIKSTRRRSASQRAITRGKILKLQRAGLLSGKIDPDKAPSNYTKNAFYKYRGVLSGRQAAVKLKSSDKAAEMRRRIGDGGRGKVVIVPREKGEKFRVTKSDEIVSTRQQYGQTIEKKIGSKLGRSPGPGERVYYTIPRRRRGGKYLKRQTFSSFDEMLYYLSKYEIDFTDIEDYIEVETVKAGSRRQVALSQEITRERKRYEKRKSRAKRKRRRGG